MPGVSFSKLILIVTLLAFVGQADAQEESDDKLHFIASAVICETVYQYNKSENAKNPKLIAFVTTIAIGLTKEFMDKRYDDDDLKWNLLGTATPLLLRWEF